MRSGEYEIELLAPSATYANDGVKVAEKIKLRKGEKITVVLGQRGKPTNYNCGSGGSFLILEKRSRPILLLAAGGGGVSNDDFGIGSIEEKGKGNDDVGKSGSQFFIENEPNNTFCAGAGFSSDPEVYDLHESSEPPQCYYNGMKGGVGIYSGKIMYGGFGGGGALCQIPGQMLRHGAGGGYTGGSNRKRDNEKQVDGGGGGSYSKYQTAIFEHHKETFGKCVITFVSDS